MDQTNSVMLESQILMTTQTPNSTLTLCRCDIHCAFVSREWSNGGASDLSLSRPCLCPARVPYFYCAQREGWSEEGREGWACPPLPPSPPLPLPRQKQKRRRRHRHEKHSRSEFASYAQRTPQTSTAPWSPPPSKPLAPTHD